MMKNTGKPCAGKLHARFDEGRVAYPSRLLYPPTPDYGRLANGLPAFAANEEGVVTNTYNAVNRLTHVEQEADGSALKITNNARADAAKGVGALGLADGSDRKLSYQVRR